MLLCKTGLIYICAIPIPIPISNPKAIPIPMGFRRECSDGNPIPMRIPTAMHTSNVDDERATDRSEFVADDARVVAVVCHVHVDQSKHVLGVVSPNLQHH